MSKLNEFTYYTIQHRNEGKGEWYFSNFDNIASTATSKDHLRQEAYEVYCLVKTKGFKTIKTGLEALSLVIIDNQNEKHKFRLVEVTHVFDIVKVIN
jgi:hypothetical protein